MKKHLFLLLALAFLAKNCDKPEQIPAFLAIQKIEQTDAADEKITDAWVYADNEFLGAFPLPAKIPILKSGSVELQIFPGVVENGDYLTPNIHPILKKWVTTVALEEGDSVAVSPMTALETDTKTPLDEDFEGAHKFIEDLDGDFETKMVFEAGGGFGGSRAGRLTVDTAHQKAETASIILDDLPTDGTKQVWLEIVYKNDFPFQFGLAGSDGGAFETGVFQTIFNKKTSWTKMYINLTQALLLSNYEKYKLTVRTVLPLDEGGKPAVPSGSIWLDNVRIIHQ